MIKFAKYARFIAVASLLCAAAAPVPADDSVALNSHWSQFIVSENSIDNQHPQVAASPDGRRVIVVWDGWDEAGSRIFLRENIDGDWLPEIIVDTEPAVKNNSPVAAIDATGNCHVAWLGNVGGRTRVFYAVRIAGEWANWGTINANEQANRSCESLALRLDDQNKPWLAWQSGRANLYAIRVAHLGDSTGAFDIDELTPDCINYNLYPEIFFTPDPSVAWYTANDSNFSLSAMKYDRIARQWMKVDIKDFAKLPANRFPYLIQRGTGTFAALWFDTVSYADRVFLGFQDPRTQGEGTVIDHQPDAINHLITGASDGERIAAVWCIETATSNSQIYLSHSESLEFPQEILISDSQKNYYTHPRLSPFAGGVAVVWHSSASDGGNGLVYYRRVSFDK